VSAPSNVFGASALGFSAWSRLVLEAIGSEAHGGDTTLSALSGTGFSVYAATDDQNAEDLSAVRAE
jgi:hypothetical protein